MAQITTKIMAIFAKAHGYFCQSLVQSTLICNHLTYNVAMPNPSAIPSGAPLNPQTTQDMPKIAGVAVRLAAMLYDGMLILALLFFVSLVLIAIGTNLLLPVGTRPQDAQVLPAWYQNLVLTPSFVLTLIGFYGIFWRLAGQTLGMQSWRLKTVQRDGALLTWRRSVQRILAACVLPALCGMAGFAIYHDRVALLFSAFLGMLGNYLFAYINKQGMALHDVLTDTVTLKMPKIQHEGIFAAWRKKNR